MDPVADLENSITFRPDTVAADDEYAQDAFKHHILDTRSITQCQHLADTNKFYLNSDPHRISSDPTGNSNGRKAKSLSHVHCTELAHA